MKIIALVASPHGLKGNTAALLRYVVEGAEAEGGSTEIVVLKGDTVLHCLACDICHIKGRCMQNDDFEAIKAKIAGAEGLILASPNYINNVSAQMKGFMDRCCGVVHCLQFWGKYGVSVVTSGGEGDEPVAKYMNQFLIMTGAAPVGAVSANMSVMPAEDFTEELRERAWELGRKLVTAFCASEVPPEVEARRNAFRDRMRSLIAWKKEEWPYEYQYWKDGMGL